MLLDPDRTYSRNAMKWFNPSRQQEAVEFILSLTHAQFAHFITCFQHECGMRNEDRIVMTQELAETLIVA